MHKESLMTTPAVSVTVFNPPEEKRSKKAGGSLMVPREQYAVGRLVDALGRGIGKAGKKVLDALDNKERFRDSGDLELREESFQEYVDEINDLVNKTDDVDDLNEIHETLRADYFENYRHLYEDDVNNKLMSMSEAESKIDDIIDRDIPDFTDNIMERKYFRSFEDDDDLFNRVGRAKGSLMVPREGYVLGGGVVKFLKRNLQEMLKDPDLIPSKKKQKEQENQLIETEMSYPDEAMEDTYHIETIEPFLSERSPELERVLNRVKKRIYTEVDSTRVADRLYSGVLLDLENKYSTVTKEVRSIDAEERLAQSEMDSELTADLEKELAELDRIKMLKPEYREEKLKELDSRKEKEKEKYFRSFEDDDDPSNRVGRAEGTLLVPLEGGQIYAPNRKGNQKSYDEKAFTEQKARHTEAERKLAGNLTDAETKKYAEKVSKKQKEKENFERMQRAAQESQNLAEGGMPEEQDMPVDTYPNIPPEEMAAAEASQLPDNEMEDQYIDFILDESLNPEEQTYLMNSLEADPQLSVIFDKLIGTASEFSGAGEVEGPGTGVSDSIPARLSDGEFVMTKKATDAIGADNLQTMMDDAERAYDGGYMMQMAFGGVVEDDELEDSKDYLSKTDEEIKKVMIGANKMPSVR